MEANSKFKNKNSLFWELVKIASAELGYSSNKRLKRYNITDVKTALSAWKPTDSRARSVLGYLNWRASVLEDNVEPNLMDKEEAAAQYKLVLGDYNPQCKLPMNKQTGDKKHPAYLTCMVNILTEQNISGPFDDDPRGLCTFSDRKGQLIKTMSRRLDGAYPSMYDPIAVWETKEFYDTTTFGSRVSAAVYESALDGFEIREASRLVGHPIYHYLIVDARTTWWKQGKSYLCRLIDLIHIGLVDEVIFGKELVDRWPIIVRSWPKAKSPG